MFFEDRVSTFPNRYLVTPENGADPYYVTLSRADEPITVGTALSASNLNSIYTDCVDYVDGLVDSGETTVDGVTWFYEKLYSGIAKMWCMVTTTYATSYLLEKTGITFPFELTENGIGFAAVNEWTNIDSESYTKSANILCKTNRCSVQVHESKGGFTSDTTLTVAVQVIGKWK